MAGLEATSGVANILQSQGNEECQVPYQQASAQAPSQTAVSPEAHEDYGTITFHVGGRISRAFLNADTKKGLWPPNLQVGISLTTSGKLKNSIREKLCLFGYRGESEVMPSSKCLQQGERKET